MYSLIIALVLVVSVLMCGIVLIQESKGGGLASSFSAQNSLMGVRKTTDLLEKCTWGFAIAMVVLSIISTASVPKVNEAETPIEISAPAQQSTDAANVPSFGTQNADAPAEAK